MTSGHTEAPLEYIEEYYRESVEDVCEFPDEQRFIASCLGKVRGKSVLNLGCGPQFYDHCLMLPHIPELYVGVDINRNVQRFLTSAGDSDLIRAKSKVDVACPRPRAMRGDMFKYRGSFEGRFDAIFAVGVLGIWSVPQLDRLLQIVYSYLRSGSILLDITWDDCRLSDDDLETKKLYRFQYEGVTAKQKKAAIRRAGFRILETSLHRVGAREEYGWGVIRANFAAIP